MFQTQNVISFRGYYTLTPDQGLCPGLHWGLCSHNGPHGSCGCGVVGLIPPVTHNGPRSMMASDRKCQQKSHFTWEAGHV